MTANNREFIISRIFDAPRDLVWKAWTDPKQLAKWWGPDGFTITSHEMNFKQGGFWKFIMHGPDERDYRNKINYLEISEPERIVYKHAGVDKDLPGSPSEIYSGFQKFWQNTSSWKSAVSTCGLLPQ